MQRLALSLLAFALLPLAGTRVADAHCEVPCGIYDDQRQFEQMLEDTATIHKAMEQIAALAGKTDAQSVNQLVRWVNTKEQHATSTQGIIAQYFMTQRIKSSQKTYVELLTSAHAVMTLAMTCKQTTDTANADKLKAAIIQFHKVYEPKPAAKKADDNHGHEHK